MKYLIILGLLFIPVEAALYQKAFGTKWKGRFMGGELGVGFHEPYFSLNTDLRKRYTAQDAGGGELGLYWEMLKNSFVPGYFSAEVSAYPLLLTSALMEEHKPNWYDKLTMGYENLNVLRLLSSQFREPVAFSVFLGELMNFRKQVFGQAPQGGFGMMGYVLSVGPLTSYNNLFYKDRWVELKWKIKGVKKFDGKVRTWNLMMGYHWHENPLFLNTLVFELNRSFKTPEKKISLLTNTNITLFTAITPLVDFKEAMAKQAYGLNLGIYYPLGKIFFKLNLGYKREMILNEQEELESNFNIFFSPWFTF